MKATVKKERVVINLELTEEEFNSIMLSYGVSSYYEIEQSAEKKDIKILGQDESHNLFLSLQHLQSTL